MTRSEILENLAIAGTAFRGYVQDHTELAANHAEGDDAIMAASEARRAIHYASNALCNGEHTDEQYAALAGLVAAARQLAADARA